MSAFEKAKSETAGLGDVAAADAELLIDDRRIVEGEVAFALRSAVGFDFRHGLLDEFLGKLLRVGDGGRAANEAGLGTVEIANSPETAEQVADVASEDAAISVEFVDNDVLEMLEEARPFGVMREDAAVHHVGVGEDDIGALPDGFSGVLRGVAVIGEGADVAFHAGDEPLEFVELVFGKGFGGEEIESAGLGVLGQRVEDGQVVAERLAAGGGCGDDDVRAGADLFPSLKLMGVEFPDALLGEDCLERLADIGGNGAGVGLTRRLASYCCDRRTRLGGPGFELLDGFLE